MKKLRCDPTTAQELESRGPPLFYGNDVVTLVMEHFEVFVALH